MWRGYWRFLLPYRIGRCHRRAFAHSCSGARQEFDRFFLCEEQHRVLDAILHFLHSLYNPDGLKELIGWGGAPLICFIVFVETGFFVGFFLPGDSLLVTVGIFSAGGFIHMPLKWLLLSVMLCAVVGDQIGYRSEEHTSELQSLRHLVCRLLLEKKKNNSQIRINYTEQ